MLHVGSIETQKITSLPDSGVPGNDPKVRGQWNCNRSASIHNEIGGNQQTESFLHSGEDGIDPHYSSPLLNRNLSHARAST